MTVRFAPDAMKVIQDASAELGVSVAQFVREAALMRAMLTDETAAALRDLSEEVRRLGRSEE